MRVSNLKRTLLSLIIASSFVFSQSISGTVVDQANGDPLVGANISIKGTVLGASTDVEGKFTISNLDAGSYDLVISYVGYKMETYEDIETGSDDTYQLSEEVYGQQVVVTASRKSETILESAVTIEKMDAVAIKNAPKANFYEAIGNLKSIDITTASMAMPVINMRGFNSTSPDRFVQFVDGMDNQAPALNFPVGNMVGMSELDIEDVEVVYGAASSLYGPNAFNGVISMKSKSPWEYQGLSARIKTGSRSLMDFAARYADQVGENLAYKVSVSYMQADDWEADIIYGNKYANRYGNLGVQNISLTDVAAAAVAGANQNPTDPTNMAILGFSQYMTNVGLDYGSFTVNDTDPTKAYREKDLIDYNTKNLKVNTSLHYRLSSNMEASYMFNYGDGTGIYQGANRYSLKNLTMQQHRAQLDYKEKDMSWTLKAYTTIDDAGESYDAVFTGVNLSKAALTNYASTYFGGVLQGMANATSNFTVPVSQATYDAVVAGTPGAIGGFDNYRLQPGTQAFDDAFDAITTNPVLSQGGSKFVDESSISHIEGVYSQDMTLGSLILGGSYRIYDPESNGTIFRDGDWTADPNDPSSESLDDISVTEMGFFSQFETRALADELKLTFAARYDKHENFDSQFSPRFSMVYSFKSDDDNQNNGNLRFSIQSAFRNPSLQDQYIGLDVVQAYLWGNIDGFDRGYDIQKILGLSNRVTEIIINSGGTIDQATATGMAIAEAKTNIAPVKPEKVITWEIGYKSIIWNKLFLDMNYYRSSYTDFIQAKNVLVPHGDNPLGFANGDYRVYQVDSNSDDDVAAEGFSLNTNYQMTPRLSTSFNYTYSFLIKEDKADEIPAYNTPKNKWNIGFSGRNFSGFGFNVNVKHVDGFDWEGSTFFTGRVPAYETVDAAVLYDFDWDGQEVNTKLAISNLLDNKHWQAFGSPEIGRMIIFQIGTTF
jgi:iron complex outermembrane receptor protein